MKKIPLVVILGPTASGKTALAVALAKHFSGEVVSADSMQIYRGTDILSAKPTREEMNSVPHHLIDILDPCEEFSVALYTKRAHEAIAEIQKKGAVPFLVGGTGLYIDAVCDDVSYPDIEIDKNLHEEIAALLKTFGNDAVYERLKKKDPSAAARLHPNNVKRVIRALEVVESTGKSLLEFEAASKPAESRYAPIYIGLTAPREVLYERIHARVDIMMKHGLFEEVKALYKTLKNYPDATCAQAIGYKEFVPVIEGREDLQTAVETLKQSTRRYAKRQLTWFRKNERINWFFVTDDIVSPCIKLIEKEWNK